MSAVLPVYTGKICSVDVRFFDAPNSEPGVPWVSLDDLADAALIDDSVRIELAKKVLSSPFGDCCHRVSTATGPLLITQHGMAMALIDSMVVVGYVSAALLDDYTSAVSKATSHLLKDMNSMKTISYVSAILKEIVQ